MIKESIQGYYRACDRIEDALRRAGYLDLHAEQAVLLYLLGERTLCMGQLGGDCYFGKNATYNVVKLVLRGYLVHEPNPGDGRSFIIRATEKAAGVRKTLEGVRA